MSTNQEISKSFKLDLSTTGIMDDFDDLDSTSLQVILPFLKNIFDSKIEKYQQLGLLLEDSGGDCNNAKKLHFDTSAFWVVRNCRSRRIVNFYFSNQTKLFRGAVESSFFRKFLRSS
jgi:hypothetical protein